MTTLHIPEAFKGYLTTAMDPDNGPQFLDHVAAVMRVKDELHCTIPEAISLVTFHFGPLILKQEAYKKTRHQEHALARMTSDLAKVHALFDTLNVSDFTDCESCRMEKRIAAALLLWAERDKQGR